MPDGHADGSLNFVATRHGWSRNIHLSSDEVSTISYATLESILELNTLKIRSMSLRIFVEHPAGSGTYCKLRPWKDDGSLQSLLVKTFFEDRLKSGITTTLDIRDGRAEGAGGEGMESAKEWLKAHTMTKARNHADESLDAVSEDGAVKPAGGGLLAAFGFSRASTAPPKGEEAAPSGNEDDAPPPVPEKQEEDILRERGWVPPIIRRLTTRGKSVTRKARGKDREADASEEADITAEGDGEEIDIPDGEEANGGTKTPKNGRWRKVLRNVSNDSPNSFLGKKNKKEKEMTGAEVVKTPEEALNSAEDATASSST